MLGDVARSMGNSTVNTVAIVGATASGKSRLSLDLARALAGRGLEVEIVNADAMQRYRGMDIGTAKVGPAERARIPHHELDVLDPSDEASVRDYQASARAAAEAVRARGRLPVYVGGSGLYLRAALDRLDIPPTDADVRARLEERLEREGTAALHAELTARDPQAAERIPPANARRVVRALEVMEITGRPFSASRPTLEHHEPTLELGVRAELPELHRRIESRAREMLAGGLVEEAVALRERGMGATAAAAVGYPQALALADGDLTAGDAAEAIALATRRLAKRQATWFRVDPRIAWLDATHAADAGAWAALVADAERRVLAALDGGAGVRTP